MNKNMLFTIEGYTAEHPSDNKVFVNGIQLEPIMSEFTWGYNGTGPYQLAIAILAKFIPKENRIGWEPIVRKFTDTFVSGWGYGDFKVQINMFHWLRIHANYNGDIIFSHHISEKGETWSAEK